MMMIKKKYQSFGDWIGFIWLNFEVLELNRFLFITIELNSQYVKSTYDDNSREGFIYLFTYSRFRTELCLQLNCIERELLNNSLIPQPLKKFKKIKNSFYFLCEGLH